MIENPYSYVFPFVPELTKPIISLISVGIEYRMGTEYYYDNKERMLNGYLFQYTLSGSGILCIGNNEYEIQPSQAFLFLYQATQDTSAILKKENVGNLCIF